MLKQFVLSGENINAIETELHVSRDQESEIERKRELVRIKEMRDKGFSQHLDSVYIFIWGSISTNRLYDLSFPQATPKQEIANLVDPIWFSGKGTVQGLGLKISSKLINLRNSSVLLEGFHPPNLVQRISARGGGGSVLAHAYQHMFCECLWITS